MTVAQLQPAALLRAACAADLDFAFAVTEAAMRGYVEQTWGVWEPQDQRERHAASFRLDTHKVILVGNEPVGILAVDTSATHVQLDKLYLLPDYRNRGVGQQVLHSVLRAAAAERRPVRLHTLAVNGSAQRFYGRHGFVVTYRTAERVFMEHAA